MAKKHTTSWGECTSAAEKRQRWQTEWGQVLGQSINIRPIPSDLIPSPIIVVIIIIFWVLYSWTCDIRVPLCRVESSRLIDQISPESTCHSVTLGFFLVFWCIPTSVSCCNPENVVPGCCCLLCRLWRQLALEWCRRPTLRTDYPPETNSCSASICIHMYVCIYVCSRTSISRITSSPTKEFWTEICDFLVK